MWRPRIRDSRFIKSACAAMQADIGKEEARSHCLPPCSNRLRAGLEGRCNPTMKPYRARPSRREQKAQLKSFERSTRVHDRPEAILTGPDQITSSVLSSVSP